MDKEKEIINIIRNCFPQVQDFDDKDIITVYKGSAVWKTIEKTIFEIKQQAVREFAEELKEIFKTKHTAVFANVACNRINQLIKERFGWRTYKE